MIPYGLVITGCCKDLFERMCSQRPQLPLRVPAHQQHGVGLVLHRHLVHLTTLGPSQHMLTTPAHTTHYQPCRVALGKDHHNNTLETVSFRIQNYNWPLAIFHALTSANLIALSIPGSHVLCMLVGNYKNGHSN